MTTNQTAILSSIKQQVRNIIPDATVSLFGSRAYGIPTDESDWDILILTSQNVNHALKNKVHHAIYPISVEICSFINFIAVQKDEWQNNPSYYALHQSISGRMIEI